MVHRDLKLENILLSKPPENDSDDIEIKVSCSYHVLGIYDYFLLGPRTPIFKIPSADTVEPPGAPFTSMV